MEASREAAVRGKERQLLSECIVRDHTVVWQDGYSEQFVELARLLSMTARSPQHTTNPVEADNP